MQIRLRLASGRLSNELDLGSTLCSGQTFRWRYLEADRSASGTFSLSASRFLGVLSSWVVELEQCSPFSVGVRLVGRTPTAPTLGPTIPGSVRAIRSSLTRSTGFKDPFTEPSPKSLPPDRSGRGYPDHTAVRHWAEHWWLGIEAVCQFLRLVPLAILPPTQPQGLAGPASDKGQCNPGLLRPDSKSFWSSAHFLNPQELGLLERYIWYRSPSPSPHPRLPAPKKCPASPKGWTQGSPNTSKGETDCSLGLLKPLALASVPVAPPTSELVDALVALWTAPPRAPPYSPTQASERPVSWSHCPIVLVEAWPRLTDLVPLWSRSISSAYTDQLVATRVLLQPPFETLCTFLCSSNNSVLRITQLVDTLCAAFGTPMELTPYGQKLTNSDRSRVTALLPEPCLTCASFPTAG